ncbi:hypothetical protein VIGAN_01019500 [Vigna angularis var. angularis]|uniref:Uncharacterized protein n=1 Tax=Vigna angularis var. angularis TaxID=157739 RepID=A0A0S3QWQ4_PHAAN|nr:hypothetical protein VIGAN_01019500 [Vigna angularis var. angularis]
MGDIPLQLFTYIIYTGLSSRQKREVQNIEYSYLSIYQVSSRIWIDASLKFCRQKEQSVLKAREDEAHNLKYSILCTLCTRKSPTQNLHDNLVFLSLRKLLCPNLETIPPKSSPLHPPH